ncbi:MAG: hypothetical protein M3137_19330 [Actinomycetota bacterium]|nr:hypothetical protein [Actinomycetota bacterium]
MAAVGVLLVPLAALLAPLAVAAASWLVLPTEAAAAAPSNTTQTTSFSTSRVVTTKTVAVEQYQTRVTAVRDGTTVFDHTVDAPPASAPAQTLVAQGTAALQGPGCTSTPAQVVSTNRTLTGSTMTDTVTGTKKMVTVEFYFGPQTIRTGNRDTGGTPFFVARGTSDLNTNTNTETDISRTTTNTFRDSEHLQVTGTCKRAPPSGPGPSPPGPGAGGGPTGVTGGNTNGVTGPTNPVESTPSAPATNPSGAGLAFTGWHSGLLALAALTAMMLGSLLVVVAGQATSRNR